MYLTKEQCERDNEIIGKTTPRFFVGNYINPKRLGEDIKVFSKFGDYDGIKNVTGYGIFSSKYGILVEPSINLKFSHGSREDYNYITDAGMLSVDFLGELKLRPGLEEGYVYGPGGYNYSDKKAIEDISYSEVQEVLKYAIEKSNGETIKPITPEELYAVVAKLRGLDEEKSKGIHR